MRRIAILFLPLGFDRGLGLAHIRKPVLIQTLLSEVTIESFDKGIVGGFPGRGKIQLNSLTIGPEV